MYMLLAVVSAAIGVLDVVVGLGAIYALIMFVFAMWALSRAGRAAGRR
jgi:hypothetical protein